MTLPDPTLAALRYGEIPYRCIRDAKSILDVGSSDGSMAKFSCYGPIFDRVNDAGNYLGLDIQEFEHTYYHIIKKDLRDFTAKRKYDLVIASHIIEHIEIEEWQSLFHKLFGCVAEGGYLLVNVPFRQRKRVYNCECEPMNHKVYGIDKKLLESFLSGGHYLYSKGKWRHFREKGEFLLYAVFRLFFRVLTSHPYSILKGKGYVYQITGIWRKRFEE